jgi:hypothetical protein
MLASVERVSEGKAGWDSTLVTEGAHDTVKMASRKNEQ